MSYKLRRCSDNNEWNKFVLASPQNNIFCRTGFLDALQQTILVNASNDALAAQIRGYRHSKFTSGQTVQVLEITTRMEIEIRNLEAIDCTGSIRAKDLEQNQNYTNPVDRS